MEDGSGTNSTSFHKEFESLVSNGEDSSAVLLSGCATKAHKHILYNFLVLKKNLRSLAFEQVLTLFLEK